MEGHSLANRGEAKVMQELSTALQTVGMVVLRNGGTYTESQSQGQWLWGKSGGPLAC